MRIVIDLQGSQTGSRYRGIGRYSLSLAKAMLRNRKQHDIVVALNGAFVDTIKVIEDDLEDLLPKKKIHLWHAPGPTGGFDPANFPRRKMAEKIREAFLASLRPDVVLVSSLFEGGDDSAVISIGTFDITVPVATVLYDLIPFTRPESHHKSENFLRWYMRQIEFLKKSRHLLAISDYTRQEGMQALKLKPETVTTISSAYDSADTGRDPGPVMAAAVELLRPWPQLELLWASPREILNVFHADQVGCHIITATSDILKKLGLIGKDLAEYSLETVKMFKNDAESAGFSLVTGA